MTAPERQQLIEEARAWIADQPGIMKETDSLIRRLADALEESERERDAQTEWKRRWQDPNEAAGGSP